MPTRIRQHPRPRRILFLAALLLSFFILPITLLKAMTPAVVESRNGSFYIGSSQLEISLKSFATGLERPVGIAGFYQSKVTKKANLR